MGNRKNKFHQKKGDKRETSCLSQQFCQDSQLKIFSKKTIIWKEMEFLILTNSRKKKKKTYTEKKTLMLGKSENFNHLF
jgi:hypothetical protein